MLELQIEQFIMQQGECSMHEVIKNVVSESSSAVRSAVSRLAIKNCWFIRNMNGKLMIFTKREKPFNTIHHRNEENPTIIEAKLLPQDNDWVVRCKSGCNVRLFFDGKYTATEVRSVYSKINNIHHHKVTACRYHKKQSFKTMQNWD